MVKVSRTFRIGSRRESKVFFTFHKYEKDSSVFFEENGRISIRPYKRIKSRLANRIPNKFMFHIYLVLQLHFHVRNAYSLRESKRERECVCMCVFVSIHTH